MEGRLCPAVFKCFDEALKKIYVQAEQHTDQRAYVFTGTSFVRPRRRDLGVSVAAAISSPATASRRLNLLMPAWSRAIQGARLFSYWGVELINT